MPIARAVLLGKRAHDAQYAAQHHGNAPGHNGNHQQPAQTGHNPVQVGGVTDTRRLNKTPQFQL